MKVIVCTKQVPDVAELGFDETTRTVVREGVPAITNPYDRRAFAFAAALRESHGAEIVVATMGPPQAADVLRDGLACGATRAVHICDRALAGSDTLATARVLARFCEREAPFDLILVGRNSTDGDTGHIGPELAELLGVECAQSCSACRIEEGGAFCECETEEGFVEMRFGLPAVVTCGERLARPLKPSDDAWDAARAAPIQTLTAADLGMAAHEAGFEGSPTVVLGVRPLASPRPPARVIRGDPDQVAAELARVVREATAAHAGPPAGPAPDAGPAGTGPPGVWVLAPVMSTGELWPAATELLAPGRAIAVAGEVRVASVVFTPAPDTAAQVLERAGADHVLTIDAGRSPQDRAAALVELVRERRPLALLGPSVAQVREVLPRVAARLGLGMTADCIGFEVDADGRLVQHKPAFGGLFVAPIVSRTDPQVATARPGVFAPPAPNPARRAELETVRARPVHEHVVGFRPERDAEAIELERASCVVCIGMGVGGPEALGPIRGLARALGAPIGATRRVVDRGWLPRQVQIGLTGRVVCPDLYVAVGVRGAFNHVVGMHRARTVVAINNDPDAPIFEHATFAAVADWAEVVPRLTERLLRGT